MKNRSRGAKIHNNALIHYVNNGIMDSPQNKCLFYDCTNLHYSKQNLKVYEETRLYIEKDCTKNKSNFLNIQSKSQSIYRLVTKYDNVDKF